MGHRGGRRSQPSISDENSEILTEEITAMCPIFEEDYEIVSESPIVFSIKLRSYSEEDSDVSALPAMRCRCLQGYPYKCPELQIQPEKGLTKTDADNLLSLLYD